MSNYAKVAKFPLVWGKDGNYAILISPALGQRLLCCPKRGTYVPPFFVYGKAGPTVLATPLGPWSSAPHLAAFEKAGKTFTCLYLTRARAFQLAPLTPSSAALKAAFASCPVRPRTQARAACQPFPANPAAFKRRSRLVPRGHPLAFWGRACYNRP